MGNWFRMYNQNRFKVWVGIIIVAFVLLIIYTLNGIVKKNNVQKIAEQQSEENFINNQIDYDAQSHSIVDESDVSDENSQNFGKLIDDFLTYCKNHEPDKAYDLLSQDCKSILYPTEELFKVQYYEPKFSEEKTYQFQSWSSSNDAIYLVRIYDNMLTTGKGNGQKYIQDYITAVKENDTYRLNVNSFIGISEKNASAEVDGIKVTVLSSEKYIDYEITTIEVRNDCPYDILLDSENHTGSMYLVDENDVKFEAMLFENSDTDLHVESGKKKKIKIKFSNPYQSGNHAVKYVFSDVYVSADELNYDENYELGSKSITVEI